MSPEPNRQISPWANYLDARLLLIHEWTSEGKSTEEIYDRLRHLDLTQVRLLQMTPAEEPTPGSARWLLQKEKEAG